MVALTIRNIDETLKRRLRVLAAANGRSMEAEAHELLKRGVASAAAPQDVGRSIRRLVEAEGGIDLDLPARRSNRKIPRFE